MRVRVNQEVVFIFSRCEVVSGEMSSCVVISWKRNLEEAPDCRIDNVKLAIGQVLGGVQYFYY